MSDKTRCPRCGKKQVETANPSRRDVCRCAPAKAARAVSDEVVRAGEAKPAELAAADVYARHELVKSATPSADRLVRFATAVKRAHWAADTAGTAHEALGELYEAVEGLTDKFVEVGRGKDGAPAEPQDYAALADEGAAAVEEMRAGLDPERDQDLLNVLADVDAAVNKARYILKTEDKTMDEQHKITAAEDTQTRSDAAKKGWEKRVSGSHSLSNIANEESNKLATMTGGQKINQHFTAGNAHLFARNEHRAIAQEASASGLHAQGSYHQYLAEYHNKKWQQHMNDADAITKSSETSTADTVRCRESATAALPLKAADWKHGESVRFCYMPAGVHQISAGFRQGSIEMCVKCDEATAQAVQASLERHRSERPAQEPYGCTDHDEKAASFRIKPDCAAAWEDGRGVVLTAYPTRLGVDNVNGELHRSWSPSFTTDADYAKAECGKCEGAADDCCCGSRSVLRFPDGVRGSAANPAEVTGVDFCVGTLTNKPAFRAMPAVKGSEGANEARPDLEGGDAVQAAEDAQTRSEAAKKGWEGRTTGSGKEIPHISDPTYTKSEKVPKWSVSVHPLMDRDVGGRQLKQRLPHFSKEDHMDAAKAHMQAAGEHEAAWGEKQKEAHNATFGKDPEFHDYRISGIGRDEYSEEHKDQLRNHAHSKTAHIAAAHAHWKAAGKHGVTTQEMKSKLSASDSSSPATVRARWHVRKAGGRWEVVKEGGGSEGFSDTEAKAQAHLRALYAHAEDVEASEKVTAAGTSEGVRKSWDKRRRQAWGASEVAHQASSKAFAGHGTHEHAKLLHAEAATIHNELASLYEPGTHNFEVHDSNARAHEQAAAHHENIQSERNTASEPASDLALVRAAAERGPVGPEEVTAADVFAKFGGEVVKAAGTSEGARKGWSHRVHFNSYSSKKAFIKDAKLDKSEYSDHGEGAIDTDEATAKLAEKSPHVYQVHKTFGRTSDIPSALSSPYGHNHASETELVEKIYARAGETR